MLSITEGVLGYRSKVCLSVC